MIQEVEPLKVIADRLRGLRNEMHFSQTNLAKVLGITQSSINRYENDDTSPSYEVLLKYADYFDVSLDYILGRCDEPEGRLYKHQPKIGRGNPDMQKFVEMCFDPSSPMNARLKETLFKMLEENS